MTRGGARERADRAPGGALPGSCTSALRGFLVVVSGARACHDALLYRGGDQFIDWCKCTATARKRAGRGNWWPRASIKEDVAAHSISTIQHTILRQAILFALAITCVLCARTAHGDPSQAGTVAHSSQLTARQVGSSYSKCSAQCSGSYDLAAIGEMNQCPNSEFTCFCRAEEKLSSKCLGCLLGETNVSLTPEGWFQQCNLIPTNATVTDCDSTVCQSAGDVLALKEFSRCDVNDLACTCRAFGDFATLQCIDCYMTAGNASLTVDAADVLQNCANLGYFRTAGGGPIGGPSSFASSSGTSVLASLTTTTSTPSQISSAAALGSTSSSSNSRPTQTSSANARTPASRVRWLVLVFGGQALFAIAATQGMF